MNRIEQQQDYVAGDLGAEHDVVNQKFAVLKKLVNFYRKLEEDAPFVEGLGL